MGERFSPPWVEDADRVVTEYERSGRDIDITVYLDEGLPLETLFSDTHVIEVLEEGLWGATVALAEEDRIPNKDFSLTWSLAGTQPRASALAHRPDPTEPGYVAVTLEPQILGDLFEARPRELLFVVDASGSMKGQPYETARQTVLLALEEMRPEDTFNLVRFSDASSALFDRPQPSTPRTRHQAKAWLDVFEGGGTMMEEGIVHSLTLPGDPDAMRLVLMLTDGFVSNEGDLFGTVRRHLGNSRLFSLGIGSSTNRYLLEGLAEMGRGDVSYQLPDTPMEETVAAFYDRIAHPAMSDIHIDWGGLEVTEQYPKEVPDLWAGQPLRVVARYEGAGTELVRVQGIVGREAFALGLPVTFPKKDLHHEGVAKLWARRKIRDIEWYPRDRTPEEVKAEVIGVALEHHLVSRYTSLVAIDEEPSPCGPITLSYRVPLEVPQATHWATGLGTHGYGKGGGGAGYGYGSGVVGLKGQGYARRGSGGLGGSIGAVGGQPIILGALDRGLIREVVERNQNPIRYCYQRELTKDPTLTGKVVVKFVVSEDGLVSTASIKSSTLGNSAVETCVVRLFLRMRFPANPGGGIVVASYPFVFRLEDEE
jgi:Ca-activated chloride channel family protein